MGRKFDTVLFDLDGTLTNSMPGIFGCIRYALTTLGREIPDDTALKSFLGPPLFHSFRTVCGLSEEESDTAVRLYRERYSDVMISENSLYDGVSDMLKRLSDAGVSIAMATSKPQKYAEKIADGFGIARYFAAIIGASPDDKQCGKAHLIERALAAAGASDKQGAVMVGDRRYDIEGAVTCGIHSIGAVYGYGSKEELLSAGADFLAESPLAVADIILNQ